MKVKQIINEITSAFAKNLVPPTEYILSEYNSLIRTLFLMLPGSDGELRIMPADGYIETGLSAAQVKKVFCKEDELMRVSDALRDVLDSSRLYTPHDLGIYVTAKDMCTVYYRIFPEAVDMQNFEDVDFALDSCYIPLVRSWLWHRIYLYIGDFESADVFALEYNRLLELFKVENGVVE